MEVVTKGQLLPLPWGHQLAQPNRLMGGEGGCGGGGGGCHLQPNVYSGGQQALPFPRGKLTIQLLWVFRAGLPQTLLCGKPK